MYHFLPELFPALHCFKAEIFINKIIATFKFLCILKYLLLLLVSLQTIVLGLLLLAFHFERCALSMSMFSRPSFSLKVFVKYKRQKTVYFVQRFKNRNEYC